MTLAEVRIAMAANFDVFTPDGDAGTIEGLHPSLGVLVNVSSAALVTWFPMEDLTVSQAQKHSTGPGTIALDRYGN